MYTNHDDKHFFSGFSRWQKQWLFVWRMDDGLIESKHSHDNWLIKVSPFR